MAETMEAGEALSLLQAEQEVSEAWREQQGLVNQVAAMALRDRGELVFVQPGMYGGRDGIIGSANPGVLLTQATRPIEISDSYVALRHKPLWPNSEIELLQLDSDDPEKLRTAGDEAVLAVPAQRLAIPGVLKPKRDHALAVAALVSTITAELELLKQIPRMLPVIGREGPSRKVINIRENPDVLGQYMATPYMPPAND